MRDDTGPYGLVEDNTGIYYLIEDDTGIGSATEHEDDARSDDTQKPKIIQ